MAKNSIMMITPATCHMLAKVHTDDSPETELYWLRVGLVLFAQHEYNHGSLTEEDLRGMIDLAWDRNNANVRERAFEILS